VLTSNIDPSVAFTLLTAQLRHVQIDFIFECAFNDFLSIWMGKSMIPIYHVSRLSSRSAILKRSLFDSASSFLNVHQPPINIKHRIQIIFAIIDEVLSETFPEKLNQEMKRTRV
jgi:hypothetical protein